MGNTGNASGGVTHLHFEIRTAHGPTDPLLRLSTLVTPNVEPTIPSVSEPVQESTTTVRRTSLSFEQNLKLGMTHKEVKALQVFLNSEGFLVAKTGTGSQGHESDYFGTKTRLALMQYQSSVGVRPALGYFGPITRATISQ